jgi:hypothetical protein
MHQYNPGKIDDGKQHQHQHNRHEGELDQRLA